MNVKLVGVAVAFTLATLSAAVNAVEPAKASAKGRAHARELAFLAAPIKTAQDLKSYLEMTEGRYSPLNKLPLTERDQFLQSITWNERGVTGFSSAPFVNSSATEAYQILALFGIQHLTPMVRPVVRTLTDKTVMSQKQEDVATPLTDNGGEKDYEGYRCSDRATCSSSPSEICTSNC